MKDNGKLSEIVSLSSFGILLVVFGHSYPNLKIEDNELLQFMYFVRKLIYSFHMPLFMFISGFLFIHTAGNRNAIGYAPFIKKKIVRLLIPYLILSAAAFAQKSALADIAWRDTEVSFRTFSRGLVYPLSNMNIYFWFLPTLFIIFLAAPLMHKAIRQRNNTPLLVLMTAGLTALNIFNPFDQTQLLNLSGVARLSVYFWAGCMFCEFKPRTRRRAVYAAVAAVSLSALIAANLYILVNGKTNSLSFIAAICGMSFAYSLVKLAVLSSFDPFRAINGYSYQIYLLSWFFQTAARVALYEMHGFGFFTSFFAMFIAGLFGPVSLAMQVKQYSPKTGFIIGMHLKPTEQAMAFRRLSAAKVFTLMPRSH